MLSSGYTDPVSSKNSHCITSGSCPGSPFCDPSPASPTRATPQPAQPALTGLLPAQPAPHWAAARAGG
jgi:hypothetical protein